MKVLILGGTRFLGRALAEAVLERGHELTLFNRGQTNPDLFPGVEKLHGDRDGDLAALEGCRWKAVIDTCGYVPRVVRQSAELLVDAVAHYTFVSTLSVYADFSQVGIDETAPLGDWKTKRWKKSSAKPMGRSRCSVKRQLSKPYPAVRWSCAPA